MDFLVCSGWDDVYSRYWWQSVVLIWRSVQRFPLQKLTDKSKNEIFSLLDSYVNFKLVWVLLSSSRNRWSSCSPWDQIKKMSSIYRNQTIDLSFWLSRKSVSTLSVNMQAYSGAHFVPIAVPDSCCLTFPLNSK